ncbi:MAG: EamA family transporter [Steroidobacteraceae bacterium]|jgi:drug/metabolite transporter (DMT)-like permease
MQIKYAIQILLLSAVWGVSFLMIRIAGHSFPPLWVAMLRCALGASLLWIIMRVGGNKLPPRRLLPWLVLVALLNNAIPFTCFAWGERTVPSNIAAVLNATTPIWTLLFSMAVYRTRATVLTIAGVLLSFAGVLVVIATHGNDSTVEGGSANIVIGATIIGFAAVAYAVATLVAKLKLGGLDPIGLATTQLSLATLMLTPVALSGERPAELQMASLTAIAVLGFAGSGIAYLLYYRLLEHVTPTQLAAVTYVLPIWGLLWGLFAHESIGLYACLGVAITIGGLILLNLRTGSRGPEPSRGAAAS